MKISLFILLFLSLSGPSRAQACGGYFQNPVTEGADPWIVKHEGYYYFCAVTGKGIGVSRSECLHRIDPVQQVWMPKKGKWNSACVWAPELHPWNGKWYILYAAGYGGPPYIHQKTGVLESVTGEAMGEYIEKGMVYTGDHVSGGEENRWSIDMTLLEYGGKLYGIWSGWEDAATTDKTPQHLYIAEMENPWTAKTGRVRISTPDAPYELNGKLPVNEGPQALRNGDDLFIVYSCGQSWLPTYKLSYLRLKKDSDPMVPGNWVKSPVAVFEGTATVHGVGHACFTTSPDDTENYIVYHAKKEASPGWARDVRIQRFHFSPDGAPVFGVPMDVTVKIPLPSGACDQKPVNK